MKLLGIDVGTGGSRALVIDEGGRVVASSTSEHAAFSSPRTGWAEQDARDWWRASREAVRAVLSSGKVSAEEIAAVGLTGQMHGAVLLDERDEPLRPSIIWCDVRTHEQCRALTEQVGAERLIQLVSNPALEGFTLPKMLWVREREPEVWARVRAVLLPKDYVRLRLTGAKATDVADASGTLLFDVGRRRWSEEMLSLTGLDASLLPEVFESPEVTGRVSSEGAEATGLLEGTPVVAGAGDQAAGAVGMGIVRPGAVSATIGTSGVVFAATDRPALDPRGRVHTFCHAVPGRWHVMGVTQGAGLSLRWFRDNFGAGHEDGRDPYERLTDEAAQAPPGSDGALWAPYLMGERTPHLDPHARAALVGLTASHTRAHVVRAIIEGVTFSLRDTFEIFKEMGVPAGNVRLGGGGARSKLWRQIQADVYGREVELVEAEEGGAYGAALLAGVGSGAWASVDEACAAAVRVRERVAPQPDTSRLMDERYAAFRAVYPALRNIG
ncbi:MAG TPA: xylulokinase [Pyrinomonadaceae bacterium]|nr:xylulokinase [Pyrinomonadaceae bacterium]